MKFINVDFLLARYFKETEKNNVIKLVSVTLTFDKLQKVWSNQCGSINPLIFNTNIFYSGGMVNVHSMKTNRGKDKDIDIGINLFNPHDWSKSELVLNDTYTGRTCDNVYNVVVVDDFIIILETGGSFKAVMLFKDYLKMELSSVDLSLFPEYDMYSLFEELFKPSRILFTDDDKSDYNEVNVCLDQDIVKMLKIKLKELGSDMITEQLDNLKGEHDAIYIPGLTPKELSKVYIQNWRANEPRILNFLSKYDSVYFNWRVKDLYREIYKYAKKGTPIQEILFRLL